MRRRYGLVPSIAAAVSVSVAVLALACGSSAPPDDTLTAAPGDDDDSLGVGTDLAATDECLSCHHAVEDDWQQPGTHRQLFDCETCHAVADMAPGAGHAQKVACSNCHSQGSHSSQSCTTCHNQHGSANAYMIRTVLTLPDGSTADIHFTRPEGASADGLVRTGVDGEVAGTGLCEVCHDNGRAYYNRDGTAAPHDATWCASCHTHSAGFVANDGSTSD